MTGRPSTEARDLLDALADPGLYPDAPAVVERRETLISWVFLAGERAYKVKKPVVLPFLDYGSLARRHRLCREEVVLNRRLAPRIYLGVRSIAARAGRLELAPEDDERAVEYAVEMRRYDDESTLAERIRGASVAPRDLADLGRALAAFHAEARPVDGGPDELARLMRPIQETLGSLQRWPEILAPARLAAAQRFVASYVAGHRELIEGRVLAGRVRDGHGDLRAEHVVFARDGIEVVDCVEFDPELRRIDVGADLAFLLMDVTALGAPATGRDIVEAYRAAGGDPGDDAFLAFHAASRAWTRAKVALFRSEAPGADGPASLEESRRLCELAERFAWSARRPLLLVVCGPPASGKSHLAAALAESSGFGVISSDRTRKAAAGVAPIERAPADAYSEEAGVATYRSLGEQAAGTLRANGAAIVDATFRRGSDRRAFAEGLGAGPPALHVECRAPDEVIRLRAGRREHDPARVSDATPEIAARLGREFEPLDEVDAARHVILRTDRPSGEALGDLLAFLDWRLAGGQAP